MRRVRGEVKNGVVIRGGGEGLEGSWVSMKFGGRVELAILQGGWRIDLLGGRGLGRD